MGCVYGICAFICGMTRSSYRMNAAYESKRQCLFGVIHTTCISAETLRQTIKESKLF